MRKKIINSIVIIGPTSSGKSDCAIKLANKFNGEIISADSRQIYRDMNLGTGKVVGDWKTLPAGKCFVSQSIPHHIIDFVSPKNRDSFNVSHFKQKCLSLIGEIHDRGKLPIICGGTGFWIQAVTEGVTHPQVKPNQALRQKLALLDTETLFDKLKTLDPARAKKIDRFNRPRLIRAIEIINEIGSIPPIRKNPPKNIRFCQIGIDYSIDFLSEKIQKRLQTRWSEGMINEVEKIREKYSLSWEEIQSFGLAYHWIPLYLQGKIDRQELLQRVYLSERTYAKKQKTWNKKVENVHWQSDQGKIEKKIKSFLENPKLPH